ncbi:MAG: hypothetical protein IJB38_02925 [Bacteroidales bacterium]|nr:hypothetical protein [Bacteroidales bacterium]
MNENGLIYGLEERPPLIVAGALGLDIQTTSYLVSMSLFVSGITTGGLAAIISNMVIRIKEE